MQENMFFYPPLFPFFFLISLIPVFSDLAADRSALLSLQKDLRGRTVVWNISSSSSPCSWLGVTCDNKTNRVVELRLPGAGLRGQLRLNSVGNLTALRVLSLRNNALSGQLPSDLASCTQLEQIHLGGNSFSGEIPENFFSLTNLSRVNLAGNGFSGSLSSGFNNLTRLRILYLENNTFTGSLPDWNALTGLTSFNVSYNGRLMGSIPSVLGTAFSNQSFVGTSLCGRPLASCGGDKLSGGAIAGIAVGSFFALLFILFASFILWRTYRGRKVLPQRSPHIPRSPANPLPTNSSIGERYNEVSIRLPGEERRTTAIKEGDGLVFLGKKVQVFSLQELLSASAEAMGKGTVGSTYKAYFENGIQVVVKRLKSVSVSEVEFRAKMEEMGSYDHQNLEPVKGYFYGREEKLLLYEPMPKGSLSAILHGYGKNSRFLSFETRGRIAVGTASAIEYLHSISPGTTHGNIKSSNIFVTDDYEARVAETGLTQLVSSISNLSGYRAPEVVETRSISQKAEVYSLGVVLLELLSGRQPDGILREEGVELPNWVQSAAEEKGTAAIIDPGLLNHETSHDPMAEFLLLALSCTSRTPHGRPSATEVRRRLQKIFGW